VATPRLTCGPDPKKAASAQVSPKREDLTGSEQQKTVPYLRKRGEAPFFALRLATAVHG
jgi:hypothetical protein